MLVLNARAAGLVTESWRRLSVMRNGLASDGDIVVSSNPESGEEKLKEARG
jgi:hypothetical protein